MVYNIVNLVRVRMGALPATPTTITLTPSHHIIDLDAHTKIEVSFSWTPQVQYLLFKNQKTIYNFFLLIIQA